MFLDAVYAGFRAGEVKALHTTTYTVQAGDTLWNIVERFAPNADPRSTIDWVMAHNPGLLGTVQPGQVILVPETVK